jgi:subtilisin family serine protease
MKNKLNKAFFLFLILVLSVPVLSFDINTLRNRKDKYSNIRKTSFKSGEVLVKFKYSVSFNARNSKISSFKASKLGEFSRGEVVHVKLDESKDVMSAVREFSADSSVEYAQPNYIYYKFSTTPNDPDFSQQWSLENTGQTITDGEYTTNNPGTSGYDMNITKAWDLVTDASSVTVAVVDSGINYNHEDLAANMWDGGTSYPKHGYDFIDSDNDPMDLNGHGTHVAGIIGSVGNNSIGNAGVCWKVKLMAVRVLNASGSGTSVSISSGINFAVQNNAKVINLSLGGYSNDTVIANAITNAQTNGVLVVVAAGNDGINTDSGTTPVYPLNYTNSNIIGVAALDQSYSLAAFSNYGSTSVDVGAPGTNIKSLFNGSWTVVTDDFNNSGTCDWTRSQNTDAGRWDYQEISGYDFITNPYNFDYTSKLYVSGMNSKAYKNFGADITGTNAAYFEFFVAAYLEENYDYFRFNCKSSDSDPFTGGTNLMSFSGEGASYLSFDISKYATTPDLTVGYQLTTDGSGLDYGVGIAEFKLNLLSLNTNSYKVLDGTSMAAPNVTGIAALLFAYNPEFTYTDVKNSIVNSGVSQTSLSGKTASGRSVDAWRAMYYINKPTGLTATKL